MAKEYKVNDLVWGKMKGYPPWPGKIVAPPQDSKPKKNCEYIYFFGSKNYAWINNECIEMHNDEILKKYMNRKGALYQEAIECIVKLSKNVAQTSEAEEKETTNVEQPLEDSPTKDHSPEIIQIDDTNAPSASGDKSVGSRHVRKHADELKKILEQRNDDFMDDVEPPLEDSPIKDHSPEIIQQDDPNVPSSSGDKSGGSSHVRKHVDELKKLLKQRNDDFMDEDEGDYPHCEAVIPHPSILNHPEPPVKEEYIKRPESPPFDFSMSLFMKKKTIVPTKKKIGFIGFTKMAKGIIKNLSLSGHSVVIWNEKPKECKIFADKLKVKVAATPADVIKVADITFGCLSDADTVENIIWKNKDLLKEIGCSKRKKGYVEMSTIPPNMSESIATEIKMKGGLYLEAPLCGSRVEAIEGTLFIATAGDKALYENCESCLKAISKHHIYISPEVGSAIKMNLIYNMFVGSTYAALGESMSLLETKNLGKDFVGMLETSDLNCSGLVHKANAMVSKNFQTETSVKEMQENFTLGLALGHEVSHSTPVFSMANEAYKKTKMMEYGDHDVSAVIAATKP